MRVRLKQPAADARQWDGDLARMTEWLQSRGILAGCDRESSDHSRLRLSGPLFTFSLADGDWLVAFDDRQSLAKVLKADFEAKYERAGLHEPVSGWAPMVQAQHELTAMLPGMLLEMGKENWDEFCKWLIFLAEEIRPKIPRHTPTRSAEP